VPFLTARVFLAGVYYGARFGKSIPWVYAYPYSHIRDPQYVGCIITLLAVAPVIPMELMMWWLGNYCYLMWLESKVPKEVSY
jgi:methylene-fatty-acyl-phospholipid synthase